MGPLCPALRPGEGKAVYNRFRAGEIIELDDFATIRRVRELEVQHLCIQFCLLEPIASTVIDILCFNHSQTEIARIPENVIGPPWFSPFRSSIRQRNIRPSVNVRCSAMLCGSFPMAPAKLVLSEWQSHRDDVPPKPKAMANTRLSVLATNRGPGPRICVEDRRLPGGQSLGQSFICKAEASW
jgi:hypothetical protein